MVLPIWSSIVRRTGRPANTNSRKPRSYRRKLSIEDMERRELLSATVIEGGNPIDTYSTIQAAINAANPGDTVLVGSGTYNESLTINKSITVASTNGAGSTFLNGNSATDNYYMVEINADDVTLEGFDISNPIYNGTADASGVVIGDNVRVSGVKILDNVIHNIGKLDRPVATFGTFGVNAGPSQDLEVAGNTIYNIGNQDPSSDEYAMGIFTWGNDSTDMNDGANIYDNVIHDITTNSSPYAVGIAVGGDSSNATVNGNDITSAVNRGITTSAYMDGAATIENNAVTGATDIGIMARTAHGSTVYRNNVSNSPIGLQVSDGGDLTSARENFFTTNGRGVLVTSNAGAVGPISANSFNGNTAAVDNESGQTVDASANWWGTNVAAAIYGSLLGGNAGRLHRNSGTD